MPSPEASDAPAPPPDFAALARDREAVLAEFAKLAFANIKDYLRLNGAGLPEVDLGKLTRDQAAAIDEVIVDYSEPRNGEPQVKRVRFKLTDKRAALVDLGRHLGLFSERRSAEEEKAPDSTYDEVRARLAAVLAKLAAGGIDLRPLLPDGILADGAAPDRGAD